jgi:predicted TIM-barrel fold metal-dependent hydrolase
MAVPHLTRHGALPPPPPLKKIAFEEHFLVPEALKMNPDGSINQEDIHFHAVVNGLIPEWFEQVYRRLMDFNETRIESMNESNISYAILSLMGPGIGVVTDKREAEDMARAVNGALAEKISEHPTRLGGFAARRSRRRQGRQGTGALRQDVRFQELDVERLLPGR